MHQSQSSTFRQKSRSSDVYVDLPLKLWLLTMLVSSIQDQQFSFDVRLGRAIVDNGIYGLLCKDNIDVFCQMDMLIVDSI